MPDNAGLQPSSHQGTPQETSGTQLAQLFQDAIPFLPGHPQLKTVCGSTKNPYPPHGRSLEIPRGRGVLKAKYLGEMYENKLEFPGGEGGAKQKSFWGGVRISPGTAQLP